MCTVLPHCVLRSRQMRPEVARDALLATHGELSLELCAVIYHGRTNDVSSQRQCYGALLAPQPTRGSGSPKKWQSVTPAMAAGLTDHVWTMEELLSYRVPPDFRDRLDQQATNNTS